MPELTFLFSFRIRGAVKWGGLGNDVICFAGDPAMTLQ